MTPAPPAIGGDAYARRRRHFLEAIGEGSAALFVSAPVAVRAHDVEFPYRQDNDFLYLTGFPEPESAALLIPNHDEGEFHLFVRPRDPERETWTGRRAGVDGARSRFGADAAHAIGELDELVPKLAERCERFFFALGRDRAANERALRWLQHWQQGRPRLGAGPRALCDPSDIVHAMRLIKDPEEIDILRASAAVAGAAHENAMRSVRPGMREFEVEAQLAYDFRRRGASGPAYPSIVAGGANATILHYVDNDATLAAEDLLLIDAGAELGGYCSDVTRTFPIGRAFDEAQRDLYETVLRAQKAAIEAVRPGVAFDAPHHAALEALVEGLLSAGLLSGDAAKLIDGEAYRPYYMHRTSHWLGLDVHDVGAYRHDGEARKLEPGMVLTIEPGLYVAADAAEAKYRGIGIRIEDDVAVTEDGHDVLSAGIPKEVDELEALRHEALAGT